MPKRIGGMLLTTHLEAIEEADCTEDAASHAHRAQLALDSEREAVGKIVDLARKWVPSAALEPLIEDYLKHLGGSF